MVIKHSIAELKLIKHFCDRYHKLSARNIPMAERRRKKRLLEEESNAALPSNNIRNYNRRSEKCAVVSEAHMAFRREKQKLMTSDGPFPTFSS